jgi:hypothetical protein
MSASPPSPPAHIDPAQLQQFVQQQVAQQVAQRIAQFELQMQQQQQQAAANVQSKIPTKPPSMELFSGAIGPNGFPVDDFIRRANKQIAHYPEEFRTDDAKIRFAVEWLDKDALTWWENEDHAAINTWDAFVTAIRARYRPQLVEEVARQKLRALTQRGRVTTYIDEYLRLLERIPGRSEADKIFDFKQGLDRALAAKVNDGRPQTLKEAIQLAVASEPYLYTRINTSASQRVFSRGNGSSSSSGPTPMELHAVEARDQVFLEPSPDREQDPLITAMQSKIDALEQRLMAMHHSASRGGAPAKKSGGKSNLVPGRTAEDIARMRKENVCFRCGKQGHFKNACPLNA